MKKIALAILVSFALAGCSNHVNTDGYEIDNAISICKDHKGIHHITSYTMEHDIVQCNDGTYSKHIDDHTAE